MPPEQGLGRDQERRPSVSGEKPARRREEHAIPPSQPRPARLSPEDGDLVTEDGVFDLERRHRRRSRERPNDPPGDGVDQEEEHRRMLLGCATRELDFPRPTG